MSWMISPIMFNGYAPDGQEGVLQDKSEDCFNITFNINGGIQTDFWMVAYGNEVSTTRSTRFNSIYHFLSGALDYPIAQTEYSALSGSLSAATYNNHFYLSADGSPVALTGFNNTGKNCYYTSLAGYMLISSNDGVTAPMSWRGSGNFSSLSAQAGFYPKYPEIHYDRVFYANSGASPSRVWWSGINTPLTFGTGTDYIDIDAYDGNEITGIISYLGDLYIFKYNSAYKITGNDFNAVTGNFNRVKLTGIPGCVCHKSIVIAGGLLYWYSPEGFVSYNGSTVTPIGFNNVDEYTADATINYNFVGNDIYSKINLDPIQGAFFEIKKTIYWVITTSGVMLSYNIASNKWSKFSWDTAATNIGGTNYFNSIYTSKKNILSSIIPTSGNNARGSTLFGTALANITSIRVKGSDSGTVLYNDQYRPTYYMTNWLDFGTMQEKSNANIVFHGHNGSNSNPASLSPITIDVYFDYDTQSQWSHKISLSKPESVASLTTAITKISGIANRRWRSIRIKITSESGSADSGFYINKMFLEYELDTETGRV